METHCRTLAGTVLAGEMGDAMVEYTVSMGRSVAMNPLIIQSTRHARVVKVSIQLADLAVACGVVGATSVRIPSYGGAMGQTVEFIFECAREEPPA